MPQHETTAWRTDDPTDPTEIAPRHSIVSLSTLAVTVVVCVILYFAQGLFLPLALGMLFAFILTPVVNFLRRQGLSDTPAVLVTVLSAGSLVAAFVVVLAFQISQIGMNLPQYQGNVLSKIDTLLAAGKGGGLLSHLQGMVENISERLATQTPGTDDATMKVEVVNSTGLVDWMTGVIIPALAPIAVFGLIFVVVVFALLERATLRDRLVQLIGGTSILATSRLLAEAGSRVSTYLVAQLLVNIIYAVPIGLGLWIIGVPNALFFGLVTLVMRFVPYIGSAVSAILPLVMAFAVSPDWSLVLWTAALFGAVELVTSNIIEPQIYGRRTGLSPLAVIVSAMFWTYLWGPMGLIIATPLTVCLVVIGHHVPSLRLFPIMLGDEPVLAESARLYDRLLAGQSFAFTDAATTSTAQRYLADYYDGTAIPALALAQADHQAGLLSDYQTNRIVHAARTLIDELESVVEDELATAGTEPLEGATTIASNGVLDGVGHRIAILGAHSRLDDAAALMLAQALRTEGADALALPHRSPLPQGLAGLQPECLILVTLDDWPAPTLELRIRQLRRRLPDVRIGVGVWSVAPVKDDQKAKPDRRGADFVVYGMEAIMAEVFSRAPVKAA